MTAWTEDEVKRLKSMISDNLDSLQIEQRLGRSRHSIQRKISRLKLVLPVGTVWPVDKIETLTRLVGEGLSAGQIGAEMGRSRNAVMGKLSRMGLKLHNARGVHSKKHRRRTQYYLTEAGYPRKVTNKKMHYHWKTPVHKPPEFPEPTLVPGHPVELLHATTNQCRAMIGDTTLCCGNAIVPGSSWCEAHRRAFTR